GDSSTGPGGSPQSDSRRLERLPRSSLVGANVSVSGKERRRREGFPPGAGPGRQSARDLGCSCPLLGRNRSTDGCRGGVGSREKDAVLRCPAASAGGRQRSAGATGKCGE